MTRHLEKYQEDINKLLPAEKGIMELLLMLDNLENLVDSWVRNQKTHPTLQKLPQNSMDAAEHLHYILSSCIQQALGRDNATRCLIAGALEIAKHNRLKYATNNVFGIRSTLSVGILSDIAHTIHHET